jgi:starch phosphorylase
MKVQPLKYNLGGTEAIFFKPIEPEWATKLTNRLYFSESNEEKFYTYTLLAKTCAEYIKKRIGVTEADYIDLQESYACILPLVLKIPGKYRFVIHTVGPWGHPSFPRNSLRGNLDTGLSVVSFL